MLCREPAKQCIEHQLVAQWISATPSEMLAGFSVRRCSAQFVTSAVSMTSKSWVIVAVLASIAEAEQYFSTESPMARSTLNARDRVP